MLPDFFKRKKSGEAGSIDIKTTQVKDAPVRVKAFAARCAPDLGDYLTEFDEPLPAWGRPIPYLTAGILLGLILWHVKINNRAEDLTLQQASVQKELSESTYRKDQLKTVAASLTSAAADSKVMTRWVSMVEPVRNVVLDIMTSANERVQLRSTEIKRHDPTSTRFDLTIVCVGGQNNVDDMRKLLWGKLASSGWTVSETTPGNDDPRIHTIEASLTRRTGHNTDGAKETKS